MTMREYLPKEARVRSSESQMSGPASNNVVRNVNIQYDVRCHAEPNHAKGTDTIALAASSARRLMAAAEDYLLRGGFASESDMPLVPSFVPSTVSV